MLSNEDQILLLEHKLAKLDAIDAARTNLASFIKYTKPNYEMKPFHKGICDVVDKFIKKELPTNKIMIFVPPQHGKSEISSRRLPSYALGIDPDKKIGLCSYGAEHAQAFNRDVQRVIDGELYYDIFPKTFLSTSNVANNSKGSYKRTGNIFETVGKEGFFKTVGVGGALTGTTLDLAIIDDPFKDREQANSITIRNRVWNWYTDVLETRLHNESQQILLFTRWHEDDLAGRILERDGEFSEGGEWMTFTLRALKEEGDEGMNYGMIPDTRGVDEALWEDRHSAEKYKKARRVNPRTFNSLCQQNPVPTGGNKIKRNWFLWYDTKQVDFSKYTINFYLDTAYTDKTENDPTALFAYFISNNCICVVNCQTVRMEFPELVEFIPKYFAEKGGTFESKVLVEPKASGKSIVQYLKKHTKMPIKEDVPPKDSKLTRVISATPVLSSGRVYLPLQCDWTAAFLNEVCAFPAAKNDDRVDCLTGVINHEFGSDDDFGDIFADPQTYNNTRNQ